MRKAILEIYSDGDVEIVGHIYLPKSVRWVSIPSRISRSGSPLNCQGYKVSYDKRYIKKLDFLNLRHRQYKRRILKPYSGQSPLKHITIDTPRAFQGCYCIPKNAPFTIYVNSSEMMMRHSYPTLFKNLPPSPANFDAIGKKLKQLQKSKQTI